MEIDAGIEVDYKSLLFRLARIANFRDSDIESLSYYAQHIDRRYLGEAAAMAFSIIDRMRKTRVPAWREDTLRIAQIANRRYNLLADIQAMVDTELTLEAKLQ